jgi:hypothetical protein
MLLLGSEVAVGRLTVLRDHLSAGRSTAGNPVWCPDPRALVCTFFVTAAPTRGLLAIDVDLSIEARELETAREALVSRFGHDVNLVRFSSAPARRA